MVRGDGGDAHLGHHLEDAPLERLRVGGDHILGRAVLEPALLRQRAQRGEGQVGIHGRGAETDQGSKVVHVPGVASFSHQAGSHPPAGANEVVVHRRDRQQHRDGRPLRADPSADRAVAYDDAAAPRVHRRRRRLAQLVECAEETVPTILY